MNFSEKIGKILCDLDFHDYDYFYETHGVTGMDPIHELNVPIRECKRCKIRHHHLMPRCGGIADNWRYCWFKPGDVIHFVSAQESKRVDKDTSKYLFKEDDKSSSL